MPNENTDFATLLKDAPMAPDADEIKVIGLLGRTHDPAQFVLTAPDGRSHTIPVEAVKSARRVAGAIGQSVVELEFDAKRLPEKAQAFLRGFGNFIPPGGGVKGAFDDTHSVLRKEMVEVAVPPDGGFAREAYYASQPKAFNDPLNGFAPFVAAMPHHAPQAMFAALEGSGRRTYFGPVDWVTDRVQKPITDVNPWP